MFSKYGISGVMRRIVAVVTVTAFALGLAGCDDRESNDSTASQEGTQSNSPTTEDDVSSKTSEDQGEFFEMPGREGTEESYVLYIDQSLCGGYSRSFDNNVRFGFADNYVSQEHIEEAISKLEDAGYIDITNAWDTFIQTTEPLDHCNYYGIQGKAKIGDCEVRWASGDNYYTPKGIVNIVGGDWRWNGNFYGELFLGSKEELEFRDIC